MEELMTKGQQMYIEKLKNTLDCPDFTGTTKKEANEYIARWGKKMNESNKVWKHNYVPLYRQKKET